MKIKPRYALQNIYLPSLRNEFCLGAESYDFFRLPLNRRRSEEIQVDSCEVIVWQRRCPNSFLASEVNKRIYVRPPVFPFPVGNRKQLSFLNFFLSGFLADFNPVNAIAFTCVTSLSFFGQHSKCT